ncbi:MarR family winged helix-turn-helix transcriptional regulator [Leifsonia sp. Root112D2]|jgi:DNA-binding MarR family transcriptional regulator|uniref:MarR family winged helix-turn-helix transcriptional regulator n=1 Tax=Leifsonia sp. Root112D2 TaxID=1736426 RepID=UPI0006F47987|nr:MarR family winged helix-turn-helix transcriptional regulator [Leifsonia sp. Root112D2]KQV07734.1 MarR family transcriptional regulator [Leifsonia sp. Root112D2]
MELRAVFDDLVRFETELWNALDSLLQQQAGVSLGTFNVLSIVDETPSCRVNDIAEKLSITVGGASQAVDRLVKRGLCLRQQHPSDRRSSIVQLTDSGMNAFVQAGPAFDEGLRTWFAEPVSDEALGAFADALSVLRKAAATR